MEGNLGKYQRNRIILVFLLATLGLGHLFAMVFCMARVDFHCADNDNSSNNNIDINSSNNMDSNNNNNDYNNGNNNINNSNISSSNINNNNNNNNINNCDSCPSGHYAYDLSFWTGGTVISEYNLVCDRSYLATLAKASFFTGVAVGTLGIGMVSDRLGRKPAMLLSSQLILASGMVATTMKSVVGFVGVWTVMGAASMSLYTVCFVWSMELVDAKEWKSCIGILFGFSFPIARLLLVSVAYVTRDWKLTFQVFSGLQILTPLLLTLVPESPRWLIAANRPQEAALVQKEILEKNGTQELFSRESMGARTDTDATTAATDKRVATDTREHFLMAFKSSSGLRLISLAMYWNWFAASFIIYGLDLNWQSLTDNLVVNFTIGSALQFPAKLIALVLVVKGKTRKMPVVVSMVLSGAAFLMSLAFPKAATESVGYSHNWPLVACAMFGSTAVSVCFPILWVYTAELYPTSIRNGSVGAASFVSRLGGVTATFVSALAEVNVNLPVGLFAFSALLAALMSLLILPETAGGKMGLSDTVAELEKRRREHRAIDI